MNRETHMLVFCFKLVTGEELIAEVVEEQEETIVLKKVRVVMPYQTEKGTSVTVVPYAFANIDGEKEFNNADFITAYEPEIQIEKLYLQATTGLDIATSFGV